jgi:hypothetical protein
MTGFSTGLAACLSGAGSLNVTATGGCSAAAGRGADRIVPCNVTSELMMISFAHALAPCVNFRSQL